MATKPNKNKKSKKHKLAEAEQANQQAKKKVKYHLDVKKSYVAKFKNKEAASRRYSTDLDGNAELLYNVLMEGYANLNNGQIERVHKMFLDIVTLTEMKGKPDNPFQQGAKMQLTSEGFGLLFKEWDPKTKRGYLGSPTQQIVSKVQEKMQAPSIRIVGSAIQCHLNWLQDMKNKKYEFNTMMQGIDIMTERKRLSLNRRKKIQDGVAHLRDLQRELEINVDTFAPNCVNEAFAKHGNPTRIFPLDSKQMHDLGKEETGTVVVNSGLLAPIPGSPLVDTHTDYENKFPESTVAADFGLLDDININDTAALGAVLNTNPEIKGNRPDGTNMPKDTTDIALQNLVDLDAKKEQTLAAPLDIGQLSEIKVEGIHEVKAIRAKAIEEENKLSGSKEPIINNLGVIAHNLVEQTNDIIAKRIEELKDERVELKVPGHVQQQINQQINDKNKPAAGQEEEPLFDLGDLNNLLDETEIKLPNFNEPPPPPPVIPPVTVVSTNTQNAQLSTIKDIACAPSAAEGQLRAIQHVLGCR